MKIAVISDIHGNLEALDAVLEDIGSQGIEKIVCIGDMIGYGPNPEEVIQKIRRIDACCTMGNHELGILFKMERNWFNPNVRKGFGLTEGLLSKGSLEFIAGLPNTYTLNDNLFVHGFPPDSVKTYLFEKDTDEIARWFLTPGPKLTFVGHTHDLELVTWDGRMADRHPLLQDRLVLEKPKYIINVGSVGQPRDGDNRAKYVIWDPVEESIEVCFVPYDIQTTVDKIIERGFPEYNATRLW
ncbi:MAG: metallophosphoesterase family protein [Desulfobacterales bacterium]|jgi:predicted phosphodiesterase